MQLQASKPLKSFSLRRKSPFLDTLGSVTQSSVFPKSHMSKEVLNNDPTSRSKNVVRLTKNSPNILSSQKPGLESSVKGIVSPRSSQLLQKQIKMTPELMGLNPSNLYYNSEKKPDNVLTFDRSIFGQSDPKTLLKDTSSRTSKDMTAQSMLSLSKTVKGIRYKSTKASPVLDHSSRQNIYDKVSEFAPNKEGRTPKINGYKRPKVDLEQIAELPSRRLSPLASTDKGFYPKPEGEKNQVQRQLIRPTKEGLTPKKSNPTTPNNQQGPEVVPAESEVKIHKPDRPSSKKSDYFVQYLKRSFPQGQKPAEDYPKLAEEAYQYVVKNHAMLQLIKVQSIIDRPAPITIPRKYPNRKLLILDLDETLIHCSVNLREHQLFDNQIIVKTDEGLLVPALLNIRPYVDEFLRNMSEHFELVLFTASAKYYASKMLRYIDPHRSYFSHVFYRDSCCKTTNGKLVKDLTIFVNVPLKDMILVDNNTYCMLPQPTSGVPILNFYHDREDQELLRIQPFLLELKDVPDHREVLKNTFKLPELLGCKAPEEYLRHFL